MLNENVHVRPFNTRDSVLKALHNIDALMTRCCKAAKHDDVGPFSSMLDGTASKQIHQQAFSLL